MAKQDSVFNVLTGHFFRRFFDNDTLQPEGDTITTIARAVAIIAAPGLIVAFFLQTLYEKVPGRPLWGAIEDQYFFVLYSFAAMGAVAIFEWEMMFPDRLDFLVLTPLSIKPAQMLGAKIWALVRFFALFLVSANVLGAVMLSGVSRGDFFRQLYAHSIATMMAGAFAALFFLALGGVLLCVLDPARLRAASPFVQMLSVVALSLFVFHYVRFIDSLQAILAEPLGRSRWVPTFWFLGVYERLLHGASAPPFATELAGYAVRSILAATAVVLVTYPLAWRRMQRLTFEGAVSSRRPPSPWMARLMDRLVRRPGERAVFNFVGQTMARNNRYQVYLAIYGGTGLALAIACAVTSQAYVNRIIFGLSQSGLHAIAPLLLFWLIAGLRTAFAFPLNLQSRWVFRITGVDLRECAAAARRWVFWCALAFALANVALLAAAGWSLRPLLVQAICGLCLARMLTDAFFLNLRGVPFNQPRMPGRTNFPLLLTLYLGVLPVFVIGMTHVETRMEQRYLPLALLIAITVLIHRWSERSHREPAEVEEEMEGYEGEVQLLGLS
jgi:hypothetical protein